MTTKNEPTILPVRPGTIDAYDKGELRKVGVIVIEHENPEELRLLKPSADISGSDMLRCAMQALASGDRSYNYGTLQRETFTKLLAEVMGRNHEG